MRRTEFFFAFIFTFIIAGILVVQLFMTSGQETTFDGPTHMQTIAQFTKGLRDGDFPVRWGDGFARYGMPIPLVSQQLTAYIGAGIALITDNIQLAYRSTFFIGAWLSALLMYYFLRQHVSQHGALVGAFLFNFAPYRILNIYLRGALPEFFASVCVLISLIGLEVLFRSDTKYRKWGHVIWILGIAGIILTHPFMLIISSPLIGGYALYRLAGLETARDRFRMIGLLGIGGAIACLISSYYVLPLLVEIKYFHYASAQTHYVANQFLTLRGYFLETWEFFGRDVATRGNILQGGVIESVILVIGLGVGLLQFFRKRMVGLLGVVSGIGLIYVVSTLSVAEPVYLHTYMSNIQHPWRMLSGLILVVPIIGALLTQKVPRILQFWVLVGVICIVSWMRFPQLYTKNSIRVEEESYYVTHENTHGLIMNTVWMGDARDYSYMSYKGAILEGEGKKSMRVERNSQRMYEVVAQSALRMVDYTFYFPGWHVYVDGIEVPIQFQDPSYRGLITYEVPEGTHDVKVVFENTRIRLIANVLSVVGLLCLVGYSILLPRFSKKK